MTDIVPRPRFEVGELAPYTEKVRELANQSRADNTKRAYRSSWRHFELWCAKHGVDSLPATPEIVSSYLAAHAETCKPSTLTLRKTVISQAHKSAGQPDPCYHPGVRAVLAGIYRTRGKKQRQAQALTLDVLSVVAEHLDTEDPTDIRDRALLLLGFACALRRSELVALTVEDLEYSADGLRVFIAKSKTDQEGEGTWLGVHRAGKLCPVAALDRWLQTAKIYEGPIFRLLRTDGTLRSDPLSDRTVVRIIQSALSRAGVPGAHLYSGHSLRAGLATSAAEAGKNVFEIMSQTRHSDVKMLARYVRKASVFRANVTDILKEEK